MGDDQRGAAFSSAEDGLLDLVLGLTVYGTG